ncbi:uncharacterized protein DC041_0004573 [Schistosoma bovis]|uniref:Uncharacterized protein n=1 Tax=Schistosoma bovis TaxID=6184 RepID=A0A430QUT9_SCHBO|nr:uncharacterized protein DC041_0004573 [Schistosoma bovis]
MNKRKSSHEVVNRSIDDKIELKRELGLWSGVSITIGTIIGSGVFVTPKGVLENSGQSPGISIIIWILCGIISLLGSLCYAELGTTITHSGGDYMYIKKAFAFLTWINIMKVRWATRIQNLFTAAKLLALTVIILSGLYVVCQGRLENFEEFWQPTRPINPSRIALAFYSGLFAYAGWNFLNIITEELQDPEQLNFVAAREGQLPTLLATIHVEHLTPVPAILLNCILSLIMLIVSDLFTLINYVSFVQWLSVAASIFAMLYLRRSQPDIPRPIRLPLIIPITFLIVCSFLLILPIFHRPNELFIGMIIVLSGIPIYLLGIGWKQKSNLFIQKYN